MKSNSVISALLFDMNRTLQIDSSVQRHGVSLQFSFWVAHFVDLEAGTPEYLSPERCKGMPHMETLSDIYSLGVTFYEVRTLSR